MLAAFSQQLDDTASASKLVFLLSQGSPFFHFQIHSEDPRFLFLVPAPFKKEQK
jgi:hypothetical protein